MSGVFAVAQTMLRLIDAEQAHNVTIKALEAGIHPRPGIPDPPSLCVKAFGLTFPNPIGMAAGFDKNAQVADALLATGFGFAEVGTLTPKPQAGNAKPRLFRLAGDRAVINRMGFNNEGHAAAAARLKRRKGSGIVGVNVGANKDAVDRVADYVAGITAFAGLASYFTINVSSPNTPGLRDLQARHELDRLLAAVLTARDAAAAGVPVLLKIAPDLADGGLSDIAAVALARGVDGLIVSNTTVSRPPLHESALAREAGGLSGQPLFMRSTRVLARLFRLTGGKLPLVGVGGVDSGRTAYDKIRAGASLVQLYTGLVFGGPSLLADIKRDLAALLERDGFANVAQAVGRGADEWAEDGL